MLAPSYKTPLSYHDGSDDFLKSIQIRASSVSEAISIAKKKYGNDCEILDIEDLEGQIVLTLLLEEESVYEKSAQHVSKSLKQQFHQTMGEDALEEFETETSDDLFLEKSNKKPYNLDKKKSKQPLAEDNFWQTLRHIHNPIQKDKHIYVESETRGGTDDISSVLNSGLKPEIAHDNNWNGDKRADKRDDVLTQSFDLNDFKKKEPQNLEDTDCPKKLLSWFTFHDPIDVIDVICRFAKEHWILEDVTQRWIAQTLQKKPYRVDEGLLDILSFKRFTELLTEKSWMFLGAPGIGKTKILIKVAKILKKTFNKKVCIVNLDHEKIDSTMNIKTHLNSLKIPYLGTKKDLERIESFKKQNNSIILYDTPGVNIYKDQNYIFKICENYEAKHILVLANDMNPSEAGSLVNNFFYFDISCILITRLDLCRSVSVFFKTKGIPILDFYEPSFGKLQQEEDLLLDFPPPLSVPFILKMGKFYDMLG